MVVGCRDGDLVVTEFEGEFTATEEGFVLPSPNVGVGAEAREPLGDFENLSALFELLHIAPAPSRTGVRNDVVPGDFE